MRPIPALLALGMVVLVGILAIQARRSGPPRLAVLPFGTEDSTGTRDEWGGAVADGLTSLLSRHDPARLAVVARTSTAYYAERLAPVDQISRALDVDYIVEGTVGGEDGNLIEVRLIRTSDEVTQWSGQFGAAGAPLR